MLRGFAIRMLAPFIAAAAAAALAVIQPLVLHWTRVFSWRNDFCSAQGFGEQWPALRPWIVWDVATAVVGGVLVGSFASSRIDRTGRGDRIAVLAAGALAGFVAVPVFTALMRQPQCVTSPLSTVLRYVPVGIAVGALAAGLALWIREVATGLLVGWLWVWSLNAIAAAANLLSDGREPLALGWTGLWSFWLSTLDRDAVVNLSTTIATIGAWLVPLGYGACAIGVAWRLSAPGRRIVATLGGGATCALVAASYASAGTGPVTRLPVHVVLGAQLLLLALAGLAALASADGQRQSHAAVSAPPDRRG